MTQYLYIAGQEEGPVKIGITRNVDTRLGTLRCASPVPVEMLHAYQIQGSSTELEIAVHHELQDRRLNGEWFSVSSETAREIVEQVATIHAIPFIRKRQRRRGWRKTPVGSRKSNAGRPKKANAKEAVTLRLDPQIIARWKAKGENWRSLMEERLRG